MGEKIQINSYKIKNNKIYYFLIDFLFNYYQIFIFLTQFFFSLESEISEIHLIIQGSGYQYVIGQYYENNPSEIIVNGVSKCYNTKQCDLDQDSNSVTVKFNYDVTTCDIMFHESTNILEIDLSNFDNSKVSIMHMMFNGCSNLKKITFGNLDTSKIKDMSLLFHNCTKLTSIDLSKFDTSSVINMREIFSHCEILISIDVSKFNTSNVETMYDMFGYCYNLTSIDISNFDTSKVTDMQGMFYNCISLKSLDLSNMNTHSVTNFQSIFEFSNSLEFINLYSFIIKNDATHEKIFNVDSYPHNLKICINDINTLNIFKMYELINDCSDICVNKSMKIELMNNRCVEYCNESEYKYEYNNSCYNVCPNNSVASNDNEFLCIDKNEEDDYNFKTSIIQTEINTYTDTGTYVETHTEINFSSEINKNQNETNIISDIYSESNIETEIASDISSDSFNNYKECYQTCETCNKEGDEINNNCLECKPGFIFLNDSINNSNCYEKCQYYYYFNDLNNYTCTINESCPENNPKLIKEKNKCIDDCRNDNIYKNEYINICYEECPNETNHTGNYICLKYNQQNIKIKYTCSNNNPSMMICNFDEIFNNTDIYNFIINQFLHEYSVDNKETQIFEGENNIIYQITTSKNEIELLKNNSSINNNYNLSIIDLGECESKLKQEYNMLDNDTFIYLKRENMNIKSSQKDIDFEVYEPYNKTKVNLSICSNTINLYVKLELSDETKELYNQLKELGYNMFDINDPFYQDICTPYTSSGNTDMILNDRVDYIYNNNDAQCQSGCQFSGYVLNTEYINCQCSINNNNEETNIKNEKFSAKKLYESYFEVLKYSNYKILKCYKLINNIKILTKNKGCIILIVYFSIYFACLIIYIIKGINPLKTKFKEIIPKKEENLIINKEQKTKSSKSLIKKGKNESKRKTKKSVGFSKTKKYNNNPPNKKKNTNIRNEIRNSIIKKDKKKSSGISIFQKNIIKNDMKIEIHKNHGYMFNNPRKNSNLDRSRSGLSKEPLKNYQPKSSKNNNIFNLEIEDKIIENNQNKLDDFELNQLEYDEAIIQDKRSFINIYFSLLKREHKIIFTFFIYNDHNLFYIKLSRFIFLVATDMAMNAFFFADETMHKLYISYGKYDIFQQIPQIVYSTIISNLMEVFICFLSLTDTYIYEIKKLEQTVKNQKKVVKIFRCINIKLIIFFIFTFILFVFYWYIIVLFCAIYSNTQGAFIKDTLFSFLLSLILPFVLYLIPSGLRLCAIRSEKKKLGCIYKLSDIIPFF